jgi:hypothetical protein
MKIEYGGHYRSITFPTFTTSFVAITTTIANTRRFTGYWITIGKSGDTTFFCII